MEGGVLYTNDFTNSQLGETLYLQISNLPWEYEAYANSPPLDELKEDQPEWYDKIMLLY